MAKELISIADTRFIFATNFEGDPTKDKYRSPQRKGNIVVTEEQADKLRSLGCNVKVTQPKPGYEEEYEPTYYITVLVRFGENRELWPKIYLISGNSEPVRLTEETVGRIDDIWVENVCVTCARHEYEPGKNTLYVRSMYVTQKLDEDPFADRFLNRHVEEDDLPF